MAQGRSIHIGLNEVDPSHYGDPLALNTAEQDARDFAAIAEARHFETPLTLLRSDATSNAVCRALEDAACELRAGDLLLVTFSGHGGMTVDTNGDENDDKQDETWCLYDRQLVDDELFARWAAFRAGVRILVILDSCHSGTAATVAVERRRLAEPHGAGGPKRDGALPPIRALPPATAREVYRRHRRSYRGIERRHPLGRAVPISASLLVLTACQDWGIAFDGFPEDRNSFFTRALRHVWNEGRFRGSHLQLHAKVSRLVAPYQFPNYLKLGVPNPRFELQKPFTI